MNAKHVVIVGALLSFITLCALVRWENPVVDTEERELKKGDYLVTIDDGWRIKVLGVTDDEIRIMAVTHEWKPNSENRSDWVNTADLKEKYPFRHRTQEDIDYAAAVAVKHTAIVAQYNELGDEALGIIRDRPISSLPLSTQRKLQKIKFERQALLRQLDELDT